MKLFDLTRYKNIAIQCHNIPDADAIASGFALQRYFQDFGAEAHLVYGGPAEITKPSLLMMLERLGIEISYLKELPGNTDLLLTVDCQRGAMNVENYTLPEPAAVAVIDHHRPEISETEYTVIRPYLASCATLVWDLLNKESYPMDFLMDTTLYYGLFTDTNGLSELKHPLDRDLADVHHDVGLIRMLKNAAITLEELSIVSGALVQRENIETVGIFRAEACDANLLGFTSDIVQQAVELGCCVVYCLQPYGMKLSIRTSVREIMASEIAAYLCKDAGSGGGAIEKAGGFMSYKGIKEIAGEQDPEEFLKERVREYLGHYDHIYADHHDIDFASMPLYKKLPTSVGFVKSTQVFPDGTRVTVRTLEGDIDTKADENIYFMIGVQGEAYPIKKERFEASYQVLQDAYQPLLEYVPAILNRITGERHEILSFASACVPKDSKLVRATVLTKDTKVFTAWDMDKYFTGVVGDYLVANDGVYDDCYIVRGDIFAQTYEAV